MCVYFFDLFSDCIGFSLSIFVCLSVKPHTNAGYSLMHTQLSAIPLTHTHISHALSSFFLTLSVSLSSLLSGPHQPFTNSQARLSSLQAAPLRSGRSAR